MLGFIDLVLIYLLLNYFSLLTAIKAIMVLFCICSVGFMITIFIANICHENLPEILQKYRKPLYIVTTVFVILTTILPSEKTLYTLVAVAYADKTITKVLATDEGQKFAHEIAKLPTNVIGLINSSLQEFNSKDK